MKKIVRVAIYPVLLVSLWFVTPRSAHAEFVIDTFNDDQGFITVSGRPAGPMSATNTVAAAGAVGGERTIVVKREGTNAGYVQADVNLSVPGVLSYGSGASTIGRALVSWDGDSSGAINYTGLGGVDVTQGGVNTHLALKAQSDLGDELIVTFWTDAGNASATTIHVPGNEPNWANFLIPLASFVSVAGSGANFASVGAITMDIIGSYQPSLDLSVDVISVLNPSTVPEPSLIWLGCVGIVLLGIRKLLRHLVAQPQVETFR